MISHKILRHFDVSDSTMKRILQLYTIGLFCFVFTPIVIIVVLSFTARDIATLPISEFSFKWYAQLLGEESEIANSLITSTQLGIVSAIGTGIFGTLGALGLVRNDFKFINYESLNTVFISPLAVPGIIVGVSVLIFYSTIGVQGSYWSLVVGHILITLPFMVLTISSQLHGFDRSVEEAAKILGAGRLRTFYEVTLPLIIPSIIGGMLFAFTISFGNFVQTWFWVSADTRTLPIIIWSMLRTGYSPAINAVGTVILVITVSLGVLSQYLSNK